MTIRHFHFLSTTDVKSGPSAELLRMIGSLERFAASRQDVAVHLHLLGQRLEDDDARALRQVLPAFVDLGSIGSRVSLSRARNVLLSDGGVAAALSDPSALVAFPDDDCWYPDGLLAGLVDLFTRRSDLDFWFCRYGSRPAQAPSVDGMAPTLQQVIARASSNTMVYRAPLVAAVGLFDEHLGVGAPVNGGEDTDYAIRSHYAARATAFVDAALVGHRDPDPKYSARYFPGSFVAIARHAHRSRPGMIAALRKAAVGLSLIASGRMPPGVAAKFLAKDIRVIRK